jgi:hypothetical protein
MIYLVWLLSCCACAYLGFKYREVKDTVSKLKTTVEALTRSQKANTPPDTKFAEPLTRAEMAAELEKEKIDLLNP